MFDFKDFLKILFTILGTVIGAGFISGREIVTFFNGQDFALSAVIFAVLFFLALCILFYNKSYVNSKWFSYSKPFIYIGNLILASGMLSAMDGFYWQIIPSSAPYPVLSVIALIISNVIVSDGVDGLKSANLYLTPIILIITLIALFVGGSPSYMHSGDFSAINILGYVGLNIFTSSIVFATISNRSSVKTSLFAAITSSIILGGLIFLILSYLSSSSSNVFSADMPLFELLKNNEFIKWVFSIALLFGVFTTLLSSHYPLYRLVKTKRANALTQLILSALIFAISRLGFYNIVSFIYPIMGGIGILYLLITCLLQAIFQSKRRKNTLKRQAYRV